MHDRVILLFGDRESARYIVSCRDQSYLPPGIALHYVKVNAYNSVSIRPWIPPMNLNLDDRWRCWADSQALFEGMFFPTVLGVREIWMLTPLWSGELFRLAANSHVDAHKVSYRGRNCRIGDLCALRFASPREFSALFWPNRMHLLFDSVLIGLRTTQASIAIEQGFDIFTDDITGGSVSKLFAGNVTAGIDWLCTIKLDLTQFDVGDPQYSLRREDGTYFENWIRETANLAGYEFHELPLLDPLVWNWVGFGEIPLLMSG